MKHNVLLTIAVFFSFSSSVMAGDSFVRSVSVRGEAREEVAPNQAILSGQLVSRAADLTVAKTTNDKLAERALAVAKQFEIPKDKVSASNVYISPEYRYDNNQQKLIGYIVTRQLTITMDKLDVHERLLTELVKNGIDQVNGVNFSVSDADKRADVLKAKAVENARQKAELLAKAAGAKLGKVLTIESEGSVRPMPVMARAMKMDMAGGAADSVAPSLPGLTSLQESVAVSYELE